MYQRPQLRLCCRNYNDAAISLVWNADLNMLRDASLTHRTSTTSRIPHEILLQPFRQARHLLASAGQKYLHKLSTPRKRQPLVRSFLISPECFHLSRCDTFQLDNTSRGTRGVPPKY